MSASIVIHDPTRSSPSRSPLLRRWSERLLRDPRDYPFVVLIFQLTFILLPAAVALFFVQPFRWWYGVLYLALMLLGFLDRYILMLHNITHAPKFHSPWIPKFLDWCIGPLLGQTPGTYFSHHIAMHHPENNGREDLSSTERYRRDCFLHFLRYFFRFLFFGLFELTRYHAVRSHPKLVRRIIAGEGVFWLVTAALLWWRPWPALFVLVLPIVIVRFLMMAGNWAQHAFIQADDPQNAYKSSITCINCRYNRRAFNDGYHIGHHLYPRMHWTELPREFEQNLARYQEEGALVFEGVDFFMVWAALMLKRYGYLADRYVSLEDERPDRDTIIALLRSRVAPV